MANVSNDRLYVTVSRESAPRQVYPGQFDLANTGTRTPGTPVRLRHLGVFADGYPRKRPTPNSAGPDSTNVSVLHELSNTAL